MFCSRRNVNMVSDVDFISMLHNVQNGQICQLSLRNRLAVARGMAVIIVSKTEQVQFTQSNFFTNKT